jgi:hypothetical protein
MTKQAELDALRTFTESLPTDSYLRPWLTAVLPQVESEIRCDFVVSPSIVVDRRESERMKADTKQDCQLMINQAQESASRIIDNAMTHAQRVRDSLSNQLRQLLSSSMA